MKKYSTPSADIVEFGVADIITESDVFAKYEDKGDAPHGWFN